MKKQLLFLLLVFSAAFGNMALAQTPTQMQYSLRLSDQAGKDISVKMELRQGTMDGEAAWFQQFDTTTDSNGTCTLTLDFGSSIDWGNGPYYIVAMVDGKEIGGSILTSVPYALRAASVDGILTKGELIGRWETYFYDEEEEAFYVNYAYTFNEDGTGTRQSGSSNFYSFKWDLQNGILLYEEYFDGETDFLCYPAGKFDANTICLTAGGGGGEYYKFTRVEKTR